MPSEIQKNSKLNWKTIVWWIVFIALIASIAYTAVNIFTTPSQLTEVESEMMRSQSDYIQILTLCLIGVVIIFLPNMIEKRWRVEIPDYMHILYFTFLFCAIYLGEVRNFYYVIPYWDIILHSMSGIMLGALGFLIVYILNNSPRVRLNLSPMFVALFAFCFAIAGGAIWEIFEFLCDSLMGFNMQKFMLQDGTLLIGQNALADTMGDLIADSLSALVVSIIGFIALYNSKKEREARKVRRLNKRQKKAERSKR